LPAPGGPTSTMPCRPGAETAARATATASAREASWSTAAAAGAGSSASDLTATTVRAGVRDPRTRQVDSPFVDPTDPTARTTRRPTPADRAPLRRRVRLILLVALVSLLAVGCEVQTTVDVAVAADGSGTVTVSCQLDKAAAARMPDFDQSLLVADLRRAGWRIDGPRSVPGGGWQVVGSRRFADAAQLGTVMEQVTGRDGPFHGFALTRSHHFAATSYHLTGTVDLSRGIDAFGDPALRQALGGTMFGRSDQALALELGQAPAEAIHFRVVTHLPGGAEKQWNPRLGDPPTTIAAAGTTRSTTAWLFAFAALLTAVGFGATVFLIARYNRIKAPPSFVHRPGGPRRPWETD